MTRAVGFPGLTPPEVPRLRPSLDPCQAAGAAPRLWVPGCTLPWSAVREKTHGFVRHREKLLREECGNPGYLGVFGVGLGLCCPEGFRKVQVIGWTVFGGK